MIVFHKQQHVFDIREVTGIMDIIKGDKRQRKRCVCVRERVRTHARVCFGTRAGALGSPVSTGTAGGLSVMS